MKAVLLLSGGFDSPVAARMLLDQGVAVEALHGSFEPVTDDASVRKAETLARHLGLQRLWVAKIGEALGRIPHDREAHRYYFLLQKRLLYRLADALADQVGADVLATGENLGQVSSQTLANLVTLEQISAARPVPAGGDRRRRDLRRGGLRRPGGHGHRGDRRDDGPMRHHAYSRRRALSRWTVTVGGAFTATAAETPHSNSPVDGPVPRPGRRTSVRGPNVAARPTMGTVSGAKLIAIRAQLGDATRASATVNENGVFRTRCDVG